MRISTEREIEARVKVMSQGEAGVNSRSEWIRMRGGGSKVKNTKTGVKGLGMWGGPKQKVRVRRVRSASGVSVWFGLGPGSGCSCPGESEVRGRAHLVVGDLQQVQHDLVGVHVLEQPLLFLPHLLPHTAHLVQPLQDLWGGGKVNSEPLPTSSGFPRANHSRAAAPTGPGRGKGAAATEPDRRDKATSTKS